MLDCILLRQVGLINVLFLILQYISHRLQVKFGDTLRRFNAHTNKKELNYDIITLREHISNLIGFTLDVDYTLTYIDEDKDIVTLHDDNDLSDIAAQALSL